MILENLSVGSRVEFTYDETVWKYLCALGFHPERKDGHRVVMRRDLGAVTDPVPHRPQFAIRCRLLN